MSANGIRIPGRSSPLPSATDLGQIVWLGNELEHEGLPGLMAIAADRNGAFTFVLTSRTVARAMNEASPPKIGLALSGGGARAIAFHLGCLRALNRTRASRPRRRTLDRVRRQRHRCLFPCAPGRFRLLRSENPRRSCPRTRRADVPQALQPTRPQGHRRIHRGRNRRRLGSRS